MRASLSHHASGLQGVVRLVRPLNVVMFFAGVALGGLLGAGLEAFSGLHGRALVLAMWSAALIGAGANAINDVFDLEIDRVNRPDRPLPSRAVSVGTARLVWMATALVGVGLSALLSPLHLGIALGAVVLLYAYSAWLKRMPLAGNLAVALILGVAILYGGLAVAPEGSAALWLGAAFAFVTTLAREIAKDVEDMIGDEVEGARTLPLSAGPRVAVAITLVLIVLTLAALPAGLPLLGSAFLALALPAAGLLLAAAWALLCANVERVTQQAGRASGLLKAAMLAGILALAGAQVLA